MEPLWIVTFTTCLALATAGGVWGALNAVLAQGNDGRLRQRLRSESLITGARPRTGRRSARLLHRLGERIAAPFMGDESGAREKLRRDLVKAGIYSPAGVKLVISARVCLLFAGLLAGYVWAFVLHTDWLLTLPVGGIVGYLLPKLWLSRRIRTNHRLIERGLPDGLDLLVVCVEAGLTLDAAMQRVSEELQLAHPALARELSICHMETRIGLPRRQALKNLGRRSGLAPLQGLTAMLVQADRFGTSIAHALRIQADSLRQHRRYVAEEAAAKASVKLSFPLVLFIFPATFLVLGGPMVINFMYNGFFGGQ